mgnify:CR=1 FL=1
MWIAKNGKLIHSTDESRIHFRTTINQDILKELQQVAKDNDTHVNYLLETGFEKLIEHNSIDYNKLPRTNPKNRKLYSTTYDDYLLLEIKRIAEREHLHVNQVIEYCSTLIDVDKAKHKSYRFRVEKG